MVSTRNWARAVVADHEDLTPLDLALRVGARVRAEIDQDRSPPSRNRDSGSDGDSDSGRGGRGRAPAGTAGRGGRVAAGPDPAIADGASDAAPILAPTPPGGWADPWLPGLVHEQAVSAAERTVRGAWYTPEPVVRGLLDLALGDRDVPPDQIVDPTCGGGAFLLAALDRLVGFGLTPAAALDRVHGMDIDRDAVAVSRLAVGLWAAAAGAAEPAPERPLTAVTVGDALVDRPDHWLDHRVVVGNPPFATPLRTGAVPPEAAAYRERHRELLGPYSDLAAHHLWRAVETSGPGSTVALVVPQSVLAGRDTEALRHRLDTEAPPTALWAARESVFDAGVRACAIVLRPGADRPARIRLAAGPAVEPVRTSPPVPLARLAARALGAPDLPGPVDRRSCGVLGELATATAGFRDEYYGLVAACREWHGPGEAAPNRLMTVGAVDPLTSLWGRAPIKLGGRAWDRPVIDVDALPDKVRRWWERQARAKLVVATQSRLLEPLIDRDGRLVPATPLISVHAGSDDLSLVAAVLLAPPVVAWAWEQWFGTALTVDGLKLAARQIPELPLPADRGAWAEAAELIDGAQHDPEGPGATPDPDAGWRTARRVAEVMNRAYGAEPSVLDWWLDRAGVRGAS